MLSLDPSLFGAGIGNRILLTLALLVVIPIVLRGVSILIARAFGAGVGHYARRQRVRFWTDQGAALASIFLVVAGIIVIWFDDPHRLASVAGLIGAGVAIALQRVITAFAGYLVLLRGRVFTVGDRITMAGVRGDVVALGFMQTTVLEMGQSPPEQSAEPAMWITGRQYTGRLVRITNDRIFDSAVYNFTREFPYLWEELRLPIPYDADRDRAEQILLDVARTHTADLVACARPAEAYLRDRYYIRGDTTLEPRVFYHLTDNWIELTLRFITDPYSARGSKDQMSRDILRALQAAKIEIASGTYEIVGMPPLRVEVAQSRD